MKAALDLRQTQRLTMTPQLQQAIRLLQMNTAEFSAALIDAHETNPLLEMEDPEGRSEAIPEEGHAGLEFMDELRGSFNEDWVSRRAGTASPASALSDGVDRIPAHAADASLHESLEEQLCLLALEPMQKFLADHIIRNLNDAGYLEAGLETILDEVRHDLEPGTRISMPDMEDALSRVQSLDPVGVGARTPGECLLLQLSALDAGVPGLETARSLVRSHLPLLARRDLQALRRKLAVDHGELREAIELVRHLSPHPGYSVGDVSVNYVTPDVLVERRRGGWAARLNTAALPRVMINQDYQQLVTENAGKESFSRLNSQLKDARWLLSNIEKRHDTILSVAARIVANQQAFFEHGPAAMKPMTMREIAETLDIHESTVSRAVNGKYMLTPLGTFELRYFFSTEVGAGNGHQASSVAIQALIRELVEAEPPAKPISDMKICEALRSRGFEIARRTVAKYREQMNIPPSGRRKSLLGAPGS